MCSCCRRRSLPRSERRVSWVLPVLLVLGLGGRLSALGLFVVNFVAVISLSEIAPADFQQHVFWGSLLAALAIFGLGPWSFDRWLAPRRYADY